MLSMVSVVKGTQNTSKQIPPRLLPPPPHPLKFNHLIRFNEMVKFYWGGGGGGGNPWVPHPLYKTLHTIIIGYSNNLF